MLIEYPSFNVLVQYIFGESGLKALIPLWIPLLHTADLLVHLELFGIVSLTRPVCYPTGRPGVDRNTDYSCRI